MIVYKLTNEDGYTRMGLNGQTLWYPGVTRETSGKGNLCAAGWTHAYDHPILAVLHDVIHGNYGESSRLWECDTLDGIIKRDGQMKLGTSKLKVIKEIEKPKVTSEQMVAYAISCSLRVYVEESYVKWAEGWISGRDRSVKSALAARLAANSVARATDTKFATWSAGAEAARAAITRSASAAAWSAVKATYTSIPEKDLDLIDCAREVFLVE